MQEIYVEHVGSIIRNKNELQRELGVTIENKGMNVFVDGDGDKEFIAIKVIEAMDLGFSIDKALSIKNENIIFQILNIRDLTRRTDIARIRGRLIGTDGKTLKTLDKLTDCFVAVSDNQVGIIGDAEAIKEAIISVTSLVQGSKQGNVYARLEREMKNKRENPINTKGIKNEMKRKKG